MDTLKLDIAVGLLTRRSHHRVMDAAGKYRWILAEPLLVQLALAVENSSASPVQGAGSSSPTMPIGAAALDLLTRIEDDAGYEYFVHGGTRRDLKLGEHIRALAVAARLNEQTLATVEKLLVGWVAEIDGLFNPQRRRPLPGAACPNKKCGATRVLDREEQGEHYYRPALVRVCDEDGSVMSLECGACGESWNRVGLGLMAP